MSLEMVTARHGTPHISSDDDRAYHAYTSGSGRYLLSGGGCTVASANSLTLDPAELLVDGAHVRIGGDGETLSLNNGATGYNRNDIVALHYTVTGTGSEIVESMELTVVQGTATTGTASDPSMVQDSILDGSSETYIPYYRIPISGLVPGTPELMLDEFRTTADINEEVSAVQSLTLTISGAEDGQLTVFRSGHVCMFTFAAAVNGSGAWGTTNITTLDEQFRPSASAIVRQPLAVQNQAGTAMVLYIQTSGEVTVYARGSSSGWGEWMFCSGAYYVD